LQPRQIHAVAEPGAIKGLAAKRVAARPGKAVPIGHCKAQMVLHPLAQHHLIRVVMAESEFAGGAWALIGDRRDVLEKLGHVRPLMADCALRWRAWPASKASFSAASGSITRAIAGSVATSAPAPVAAIRARRAAPKAPPKSPATGTC